MRDWQTYIDVVGVEVVGDVRVDTGPGLESLELEFWLRHIYTLVQSTNTLEEEYLQEQ
jgi:hypothetical protein